MFFYDVEDLETKLKYYMARPEEAAAIAQAGRAHLEAWHTGTQRARQLLAGLRHALKA